MPPSDMRITQVYGIIFTQDGHLVLRVDGTKYSLAGGHPEVTDVDIEATLTRELDEEINVSVRDMRVLGYQEVNEEDGTPLYAQLRLTGVVSDIRESRPDPDTGRTYRRLLVSPIRATYLLDWGKVGDLQVEAAVRVARENGWRVAGEDLEDQWV